MGGESGVWWTTKQKNCERKDWRGRSFGTLSQPPILCWKAKKIHFFQPQQKQEVKKMARSWWGVDRSCRNIHIAKDWRQTLRYLYIIPTWKDTISILFSVIKSKAILGFQGRCDIPSCSYFLHAWEFSSIFYYTNSYMEGIFSGLHVYIFCNWVSMIYWTPPFEARIKIQVRATLA